MDLVYFCWELVWVMCHIIFMTQCLADCVYTVQRVHTFRPKNSISVRSSKSMAASHILCHVISFVWDRILQVLCFFLRNHQILSCSCGQPYLVILVCTYHRASRSTPGRSLAMVLQRIEVLRGRIHDRSSCPLHYIEKRLYM
jgi:hypothetical protein